MHETGLLDIDDDGDLDAAPPAGTRFTLNLDDDHDHDNHDQPHSPPQGAIADVSERTVSSSAIPPSLQLSSSSSGFPPHTKRTRTSNFKARQLQQRQQSTSTSTNGQTQSITDAGGDGGSRPQIRLTKRPTESEDLAAIREENSRRVSGMSAKELEKERQELLDSLSPELLQMFLKRASLDDDVPTSRREAEVSSDTVAAVPSDTPADEIGSPPSIPPRPEHLDEIPESAFPPTITVHFPAPPSNTESDADPDPSSPTFLSHLHQKYFPTLPHDPSKLSWMLPPQESSPNDPYSPTLPSVLPSSIRFDFKANLLPPRKSREIPAHLGLHHHGDAPLSAGYTIPELAHLARSSFPAQRCMAFQTLGRVLYKLGVGEYSSRRSYNNNNNNRNDEGERLENEDLTRGLWRCMKEGRVIENLQEAATGGINGAGHPHLGVKNYAVEALWLWQKGGGEQWKAD